MRMCEPYSILYILDCANSLLYGIAAKDRRKLQKLQNKAAKVIFRCDRLHPSAPLRRQLHWLPINERVIFKVLLSAALDLQGCEQSHSCLPVWLSHQECFRERKSALWEWKSSFCFTYQTCYWWLFILCCWTASLELPPFPYSFLTFSQRFQKSPLKLTFSHLIDLLFTLVSGSR